MQNVKKYFLFILLFFCIGISCDASPKYSVELIAIDTLEKYVKYFFDKQSGEGYFIEEQRSRFDNDIDSLLFYNQDITQKLFSIYIGSETSTHRYNIISLDSIFAISGKSSYTFCLNHFGRQGKINTWKLINIFNEQSCNIFPNSDPPIIIDNNLYYLITPFFRPSYATFKNPIHFDKIEDFFRTQKSMARIQFDNDTIVNPQKSINFPKSYFQDSSICVNFNFNSFTSNSNNEIIFNFGEWDSIIVFKDDKERKYLAKSKYISVPFLRKFGGKDLDIYEVGRYPDIIYDGHRNLCYRIVQHPFKQDNDVITSKYEKLWSFIVLDDKFNMIDEVYFSGEEGFEPTFSVLPQGLLFTKHIDNGLFEETTKLYILYKLAIGVE